MKTLTNSIYCTTIDENRKENKINKLPNSNSYFIYNSTYTIDEKNILPFKLKGNIFKRILSIFK